MNVFRLFYRISNCSTSLYEPLINIKNKSENDLIDNCAKVEYGVDINAIYRKRVDFLRDIRISSKPLFLLGFSFING